MTRTYGRRKTKDARQRSLVRYVVVGTYVRPEDPELATQFDAVEAEITASLRRLAAIYDTHRDADGCLPYREFDGNDVALAEAEYMTSEELALKYALSDRLVELAKLRECGCLVHSKIWLGDWTESPLFSTISFERLS
jgi:hypothetical protein